MKKYIPILKRTRLFAGVGAEEIENMLGCLGATQRCYKKGEYVFRAGEYVSSLSVLAEGKLHIQRDDYWGNRAIINIVEAGEMFGEGYVPPDSGALPGDVVAVEDSVVIFFDINRLLTTCSSACRFHAMTVRNLFFTISEKNRKLMTKLDILSKRSTRDKLITYLSEQAGKYNRSYFEIPFNRQQLADFLSVDRSAMSNELSKMRDEGMLEYNKNHFTLR